MRHPYVKTKKNYTQYGDETEIIRQMIGDFVGELRNKTTMDGGRC